MKTLFRAAVAAVGVFLGVSAPAQAASAPAMRLSFVQGDVQIKTLSTDAFGPASVNQPVNEGDQIWTPEGALAELQMLSGTYVRFDEKSAARVMTATEKSLQVTLTQGHAYILYDAPSDASIQIDTPKHSIRAFNNATFRVDLSEHLDTVGVFEGTVEVESSEGVKRVNRGQMLSLAADGGAEIGRAGRPDEWEKWNNKRNELADGDGRAKSYLPKKLHAYAGELSSGKWVKSAKHGHVWRPADVDDDWSPYENGRWIWSGGEYTWVGYEPWGWAPYHYGRWAYSPGDGWVWVPPSEYDAYWSPGYVAWYETDDYIAWAPLWPGESYYGYGYCGRSCVNLRHHHGFWGFHHGEHHHQAFETPHGLKIVERRHFGDHFGEHGRGYKYVKVDPKSFGGKGNKAGFVPGGPRIAPTPGMGFASRRTIGPDKAPPSQVSNFKAGEFKQSRTLTTGPGQSAFSPGAAPKAMTVHTVGRQKSFAGRRAAGGADRFSRTARSGRLTARAGENRFSQGRMGHGQMGHGRTGHGRYSRPTFNHAYQGAGRSGGGYSRHVQPYGGGRHVGARNFNGGPGHFSSGGGPRHFSGGGGGQVHHGGFGGGAPIRAPMRMPSGGRAHPAGPPAPFRR
jgi:hypothetical protein